MEQTTPTPVTGTAPAGTTNTVTKGKDVGFNEMIKPAALAGCAVGVFSGVIGLIPLVNLLGLCCCLYLLGMGVLAVYFLKKDKGAVSDKSGAIVGGLSGVFYAIVDTGFSAVGIALGLGGSMEAFDQLGGGMGVGAAIGMMAIIFAFVINLVLGIGLGAVGGIIGVKVLEKK